MLNTSINVFSSIILTLIIYICIDFYVTVHYHNSVRQFDHCLPLFNPFISLYKTRLFNWLSFYLQLDVSNMFNCCSLFFLFNTKFSFLHDLLRVERVECYLEMG